jgi:hypothetical protein
VTGSGVEALLALTSCRQLESSFHIVTYDLAIAVNVSELFRRTEPQSIGLDVAERYGRF